ncbi:ATP synthase subunit I [Neptunomonas phycophila]|uniref:ATP synthase subunit I n=1 Tax=Neptunomonas phycophila TaxID=1572645 RepID=UPI0030F8215A
MNESQAIKPGKHTRETRKRAFKVLGVQAGIALIAAAIALTNGVVAGYSALLGGVIYLIPQTYFTWHALSLRNFGSARAALADMYIGEIWKMMIYLVCLGLALFFVKPISPFSIFSVLILLHLSHGFLQIKLNNRFLKL